MLDHALSGQARAEPAALTPDQKHAFEENGFLILPKFFAPPVMDGIKAYLDVLWQTRAAQDNIVIDAYYGTDNEMRSHFRKVLADVRHHPYKLLDLHLEDQRIRDICAAPRLIGVLRDLLGANPIVCNSLLFERGSQQAAHFDTFFMPSRTPNMMAASWIAIEDVSEASGPVYYYPKSHKIPPYRFSHGGINAIFAELPMAAAAHIDAVVQHHGLKRELFLPRRGDVLIWHAQLLHGGSAIADPAATRCSLVTHYWTDVDFPEPDQRIDLGNGRWILRRGHQHVVDHDSLAEVDAFLATLQVTDEMRQGVPETFDARLYLARNQDVLRAGVEPWRHYREHGRGEGRIW